MTTSHGYIESKPAGKSTPCRQNVFGMSVQFCWFIPLLPLFCFTTVQRLCLLTWSGGHQLCQRSFKAVLAAGLEQQTAGTLVLAPLHLTAQKVITLTCSSPPRRMYCVTLLWRLGQWRPSLYSAQPEVGGFWSAEVMHSFRITVLRYH